jgi:hypothetical protein
MRIRILLAMQGGAERYQLPRFSPRSFILIGHFGKKARHDFEDVRGYPVCRSMSVAEAVKPQVFLRLVE